MSGSPPTSDTATGRRGRDKPPSLPFDIQVNIARLTRARRCQEDRQPAKEMEVLFAILAAFVPKRLWASLAVFILRAMSCSDNQQNQASHSAASFMAKISRARLVSISSIFCSTNT